MARLDPFLNERALIALLIAMVMLAPFSVDAYLPVLPDVAEDLGARDAVIQFTIGGFLLGTALGPLVSGPLSDAVGRRRVILFGLAGFAACAFGCALVASGEALIGWRMLQSVFGASALVAGQALLGDLFDADRLAQRNSLLMVFVSLAPTVAPVYGAWIASFSGWRMIFWSLGAAAFCIFVTALLKLPETLKPEIRHPFRPASLGRGYASVLTNPQAVLYMLSGAGMSGAFFGYLAGSPFLYIDQFGMTTRQFALIFGAGAGLSLLGNLVNIRMVGRHGFKRTLVAQGVFAVGLSGMILCGAFGLLERWSIYAAGLVLMPLQHWISANSLSGVLSQFEARKGLASAVAMGSRFLCGAIAVWIMGAWGGGVDGYGVILAAFLSASGVFAFLAIRLEARRWS